MKKLYLHIGGAKTGTSAIQSMLVINSDTLKDSGIYYPSAKSDSNAKEYKITSGNAVSIASLLKNKVFQKDKIEKS